MINNLKNIVKEKNTKTFNNEIFRKFRKNKLKKMKKYRLGNGRKSNIIIKQ